MEQTKPYNIPKRLIYEAYKRVKANKGSAGVDGQSLKDFDQRPHKQPLQALESNVIRQLLSATGQTGRNSQS